MTDTEVIDELKKRMEEWCEGDGWFEERDGFTCALEWIADLRAGRESTNDMYKWLIAARERKDTK